MLYKDLLKKLDISHEKICRNAIFHGSIAFRFKLYLIIFQCITMWWSVPKR